MAAKVVIPSREDWTVIQKFLETCGEGAIVISPEMAEKVSHQKTSYGQTLSEIADSGGVLLEYDFGGDSDIAIDVVDCPESWALTDLFDSPQYQTE